MPMFSVIIPVYNVEKYLDQCVQSVLNQPFTDLEAILVDDGSTDSSGKMCDEYAAKDPRVRVIHQENRGLGQARNAGLHVAKGEWILFLDSDDYWLENGLQLIFQKIQMWPDEKLFVTKWVSFNQQSEFAQNTEGSMKYYTERSKTFSTVMDTIQTYEKLCGWAIWKLVIHRSLIYDPLLLFLPNVRNGEDLYWGVHLFDRCRNLCFLDTQLYCYRVQSNGTLSELSAINALNWTTSIFLTACAFADEKFPEEQFVQSWLAEKYVFYMIFAAKEEQKSAWIEQWPYHRYMLEAAVARLSGKKTKLMKRLFRFGAEPLWVGCKIVRKKIWYDLNKTNGNNGK